MAFTAHHLKEEVGRARLVAVQDGVRESIGRRDGHDYFSAVRMQAGPPLTLIRAPVSLRVLPSHEKTWMSFSTMLPTRMVLLSGDHVAPCDQWPIGASARRSSVLPFTRTITSLPASLKNG